MNIQDISGVLVWARRIGGHSDKLDTFQLILRGPNFVVPAGEGQIGFFYTDMQWDSTDTSMVAAIGFGDGAGNSIVLRVPRCREPRL